MAIEYYDSISNYDFHSYFLNKVNELMSKNAIIKYLDEIHKVTNSEQKDILKYDSVKFKEEIFPSINTNEEAVNNHSKFSKENPIISKRHTINVEVMKSFEDKNIDDKIKRNKIKQRNRLFSTIQKVENESNIKDKEQNKEKMNEKLNEITVNLDKIKSNINNDLQNQLSSFAELRKKKRENQKEKSIIIIFIQKVF